MSSWITISAVMLVLLILKGFFSGSEIALVSADKIDMHHKARMGNKGAKLLLKIFQRPDKMLTTTLVGTNLSTVALTTLGTMLLIDNFGERGDLLAFLIYTPVFLIFGEIVPKSVYQQKAETLSPIIVYPLRLAGFVFFPITVVFSYVARTATKWIGSGTTSQSVFLSREQFRAILEMTERQSEVAAFTRGHIRRAVRFGSTLASEIMTPLRDVPLFDVNHPAEKLIQLARKTGNRPIPVYQDRTGNIVGVAYLRPWEIFDLSADRMEVRQLIEPVYFAAPRQTLSELLPVVKKRRDQTAVIVDEFGTAVGIVTLEDILETVVGDINLNPQLESPSYRRKRQLEIVAEGVYLLDARLPVPELNDVIGLNLPTQDYHTLGGLMMARLRRIPREGEYIIESGYRFIVMEATEKSVVTVRAEPEN